MAKRAIYKKWTTNKMSIEIMHIGDIAKFAVSIIQSGGTKKSHYLDILPAYALAKNIVTNGGKISNSITEEKDEGRRVWTSFKKANGVVRIMSLSNAEKGLSVYIKDGDSEGYSVLLPQWEAYVAANAIIKYTDEIMKGSETFNKVFAVDNYQPEPVDESEMPF